MSTPSPELDPGTSEATEVVSARIGAGDLARLDHAAARRGVGREELVVQAIDAFLAREIWSGGFIAPPPPMEIPQHFPWKSTAFRFGHRP